MPFALTSPNVGYQQIALFGVPDTTAREKTGTILTAVDRYWGPAEVIYCYANGAIRQGGVCRMIPTKQTAGWRWEAVEVGNTANLGTPLAIAMCGMADKTFGWFMMTGLIPVNCTATVAADTALGIVATGQAGAIANGKQIVNARSIGAATATVAKTGNAANGSLVLQINDDAGWFVGLYLSGTGIAATTTIVDIDPSGTQVTLSLATTAAINAGTITGTYNNATVFYNIVEVNRPFAQGQVT